MITHTIGLPRRAFRTIGLQLRIRTYLHPSTPLPFNVLFRQHAVVSLLRQRIAQQGSNGILTVYAIAIAIRLRLRTRLTPG